jgi:signal transduction histidine kinase
MKTWSLSGRLGVWSAAFFSILLLLLAVPVAWLAVRQQVSALDMRLADQGARFFHELRERADAPPAEGAADALKQLHFIGGMRVTTTKSRQLYANSEAAAKLPELRVDDNAFARLGSERMRVGTFEEDGVRVTLATSLAPVEEVARDVLLAFLVALPVLGVAVYFGSRWLGRHTLAPVVEITATAERLNARQLTERLPSPNGPEEISRLSAVLNALLDRLADGLDQARRFTGDAAHELRTPLSILQAGLEELLARDDLAPEVRDELDSLIDDHRRLATICERLLLLSRSDAGQLRLELQPLDLVEIADAAIEDARTLAEPRRITVEAEFPASAPCQGEPVYLTQVLLNLLANAVKYNRDRGRVRVELRAEDSRWAIIIGNTGPGIAPAETAHVFRRFYRTPSARAGGGNGLGLSLSRELARAHGGELTLLKSENDWTEFLLILPRAQDSRPAPAMTQEKTERPKSEAEQVINA